ncbi:MAG: RHS repeat-associated core domain-containing protein [Gemmatimonadetes bacterium]|nr:RHS repeat-associated core domain-containing protein [Gemmatimonadota bacterium]
MRRAGGSALTRGATTGRPALRSAFRECPQPSGAGGPGRHADRAVRLRRARAAHRQAGLRRRHRRHGGLHPVRVSRRAGGLRDRLGRQHDRHPVCLGSGDGQPGGVPDHRGRDRPLLCGDRQAGQRPPDHQAGRHLGQDLWLHALRGVAANAGSGVTLRYRWTGREWDAETGWYFHRARYYDPGQRRFVQEDPAGVAGGENLYAYVGGRPLVARDPTGLAPDWEHFRSIAPPECCHVGYEGLDQRLQQRWPG